MFWGPDVSISQGRRGTPVKDVAQEAKVWAESHKGHIAKDPRTIGSESLASQRQNR